MIMVGLSLSTTAVQSMFGRGLHCHDLQTCVNQVSFAAVTMVMLFCTPGPVQPEANVLHVLHRAHALSQPITGCDQLS